MENPIEIIDVPHCKHFVARKKRFCRMTLKKGQEYCGEHIPVSKDVSNPETGTKLRIVCPLDNKHTCYAHNLSKHLKICNAVQDTSVPYIVKGINCGVLTPDACNDGPLDVRSLSNVPISIIKNLIEKINTLHDDVLKITIRERVLNHPIVEEELAKPEYGDKTKKHLSQASSILGAMNDYGMMKPETCYIEFGAGKGQLSYWVAKATGHIHESSVLLVERASLRHKRDKKIDKMDVQRIRADIGDLVLDKVDVLSNVKNVVGIAKHLCGDATDLAMRCLKNYQTQNCNKISGIIIAFCCHHRCQWTAYTGKNFFEEHGLCRRDFDVMCGMVSWATCGTGFSRNKNSSHDEHFKNNLSIMNNRDKEIGLSRQGKEEVGRKCKNILNYGRMLYLQLLGFKCELLYYVTPNVSMENLCVVAYKENKTPN